MSGILRGLFGMGRRQRHIKVPILGVGASGKTTFAWGLGRVLVDRNWGYSDKETDEYFLQIDAALLANANPAATFGQKRLIFWCERCSFALDSPETSRIANLNSRVKQRDQRGSERKSDRAPMVPDHGDLGSLDDLTWSFRDRLRIATYDMSGQQFENCMRKFMTPMAHPENDPEVRAFLNIVRESDGLIVVVDLARRIASADAFAALTPDERDKHLFAALGEQVVPLCRGISETLEANEDMAGRPIIFAYTKHDIHRLQEDEPGRMVSTAYSNLFARLRRHRVAIEHCCLAYEGVRRDAQTGEVVFGVRGVDVLLRKLVVGLVESRT